MINTRRFGICLVLLTLPVAVMAEPKFVPNVVLVKFKPGAEATALQGAASSLNLAETKRIGTTDVYRLRSRSQDAPLLVAALKARSDVLIAEPDYIGHFATTPSDPGWGTAGMWNLPKVGAESAWDVTTGTASVVVAVLDTGARYSHEDLAANMWNNPGNVGGCLAGTHGYDATTGSCGDPIDVDSFGGHGTGVSGIIGAVGNNNLGLVGINWTTKIMAVKVGVNENSDIYNSTVLDAITWVTNAKQQGGAAANVRLLNCSFITEGYSHFIQDAIGAAGAAGILTIAAAGNYSSNIDNNPVYPASYTNYPAYLGTIITVAATGPQSVGDDNDKLAPTSNYGPSTVQIGAPGGSFFNRLAVLSRWTDSSYNYTGVFGTSYAAPLVAGAGALVLAACPNLSVWQLKYVLLQTGDRDPYLTGYTTPISQLDPAGRRLNVSAAINSCR
jgi:subtilisin family serine protease